MKKLHLILASAAAIAFAACTSDAIVNVEKSSPVLKMLPSRSALTAVPPPVPTSSVLRQPLCLEVNL